MAARTRALGSGRERAVLAGVLVAMAGLLMLHNPSTVLGQDDTSEDTPATGAPTISGTAQVGQTLTVDTSGIADADGLSNVSFSYQWIANDGTTDADIDGATGSTYELQASDLGKVIKVRVTFTDDRGNEESLTSAATAAVEAAATGVPTITGTMRVWETLTVDVSGVADVDGIENVCFQPPENERFCDWDKEIAQYQWSADDGTLGEGSYLLAIVIGDPTFTIPSWVEGMTISVKVHFDDDAGNSETVESEEAEITPVAARLNPTAPAPPVGLHLSPGGSGRLDFAWNMPTYGDGGSVVTGYKVQWKEAADSWNTAADVSEHVITLDGWEGHGSYTITGLTNGVAVSARAIATNKVGDGAPSAELTATPGSGLSLAGLSGRAFEENGWQSMSMISLPDPDGAMVEHELADHYRVHGAGSATIEWSLAGEDADDFTIHGTVCRGACRVSAKSGSRHFASVSNYAFLSFASRPDYESPADTGGDNRYEVTVQASDGTDTVTVAVTVDVTDVEEIGGV